MNKHFNEIVKDKLIRHIKKFEFWVNITLYSCWCTLFVMLMFSLLGLYGLTTPEAWVVAMIIGTIFGVRHELEEFEKKTLYDEIERLRMFESRLEDRLENVECSISNL